MADPFAPSSDADIPTPTREDLLPLVHGSVRDQLAAGTLDARHAENEWIGARRLWDEGHKRDTAQQSQTAEQDTLRLSSASQAPTYRRETEHERREPEQRQAKTEIIASMHATHREQYEDPKTPVDRRLEIFEAYREKWDKRRSRERAEFRRKLARIAEAQDWLQRIENDSAKAHLPRPADDSEEALLKWYDEMSRPVRNIPFAEPSEEYLRQQRITQAYLMGHRPDPKDLADKMRDDLRYQRELSEQLGKVRKEFSSVRAQETPAQLFAGSNQDLAEQSKASEPNKIVAFVESNFTWGSFGVIVAGLATLVSSAVLLVFGWAMLSVSLYRHFFKGKRWYWQILGTLFTAFMTGLILLIVWLKFRPQ